MKTVGFVGLGIMGKAMVKNLCKAGISPLIYDIRRLQKKDAAFAEELLTLGAVPKDAAQIGAESDILFLMLNDGPTVHNLLFHEGVAAHLRAGSIVCDFSSVSPTESIACAEKLAPSGVEFMDAPVSGGDKGAVDGTLSIMAGGKPETFTVLQPYFEIFGNSAVLMGDVGAGSTTKLVNQIIVGLNLVAVSEGFVLAAKAGVDPKKVYDAIKGGLAGSAVLDQKIDRFLQHDFRPGGRMTIHQKDIRNVMDAASKLNVPLPFTSQLLTVFEALEVAGHMGDDHSGIIQFFESLAGVTVKQF